MIYLRKIPNHMASSIITLTQYVKQEEINIIVKGLVIKKQFCQITKILPINLVFFAVNLSNKDRSAINFKYIGREGTQVHVKI